MAGKMLMLLYLVTEAAVGDDLASTEGDPAVVFSLFHRCSG